MRICWIFVAVLTSHHELFRRKINHDYLFSEHRKRCRIILQKVQGIVVFKSKLFASRERSRFQRNVNTNDFVSHFFGWIFFFKKYQNECWLYYLEFTGLRQFFSVLKCCLIWGFIIPSTFFQENWGRRLSLEEVKDQGIVGFILSQ